MPKVVPAVIEPELDSRIHKTESLVGKYDSAALIDANLSNAAEFPSLQRQAYMEHYCTTAGNPASHLLPEFRGLQTSSLINLRNLPVFGTTGPVLQCTRFLINRIQNGSLWLTREIPIHAEDIHRLTGLSQTGADVSTAGQTSSKRARNSGNADFYTKYGTRRGGK